MTTHHVFAIILPNTTDNLAERANLSLIEPLAFSGSSCKFAGYPKEHAKLHQKYATSKILLLKTLQDELPEFPTDKL